MTLGEQIEDVAKFASLPGSATPGFKAYYISNLLWVCQK